MGFLFTYWGVCLAAMAADVVFLMDAVAVVPGSTRLRGASKRMVRWCDTAGLMATDLRGGGVMGERRLDECLIRGRLERERGC